MLILFTIIAARRIMLIFNKSMEPLPVRARS